MGLQSFGKGEDFIEDTVDAEPDLDLLVIGFNVYVARLPPDGLSKNDIDKSNDRGFVVDIQQVIELFDLADMFLCFNGAQVLHHLLGIFACLVV